MDIQHFLSHIHDLTDLELAVLLSLIAEQNCLITTTENLIDDLSSELALIASEVFGLSYSVVSLEDCVCVERFGEAILDQDGDFEKHAGQGQGQGQRQRRDSPAHAHDLLTPTAISISTPTPTPHSRLASVNIRASSIAPSHNSNSHSHSRQNDLDTRTVTSIIIAKNFNHAPREVQIAALELITRRRIYSRTTVHRVPKTFVFIPLVSTDTSEVRLNEHLNDRISMSHFHDPVDGFANLEELGLGNAENVNSNVNSDSDSDSEARRSIDLQSQAKTKSISDAQQQPSRLISAETISHLRLAGTNATITPEIRRHIQDITVFLRMTRGVDGGITPFATTQFVNLCRYLAPLHGIDFVTPSLVALAARKVYLHRIVLAASPERERSVQWGSDVERVREVLGDLTPGQIIEDVLAMVPSPV